MPDSPRSQLRTLLLAATLLLGLPGCDVVQQKLGIEAPTAKAARLEVEGKAVGGAVKQQTTTTTTTTSK